MIVVRLCVPIVALSLARNLTQFHKGEVTVERLHILREIERMNINADDVNYERLLDDDTYPMQVYISEAERAVDKALHFTRRLKEWEIAQYKGESKS